MRRNMLIIREVNSVDNFCYRLHEEGKSGEAPTAADAARRLAMLQDMKV